MRVMVPRSDGMHLSEGSTGLVKKMKTTNGRSNDPSPKCRGAWLVSEKAGGS